MSRARQVECGWMYKMMMMVLPPTMVPATLEGKRREGRCQSRYSTIPARGNPGHLEELKESYATSMEGPRRLEERKRYPSPRRKLVGILPLSTHTFPFSPDSQGTSDILLPSTDLPADHLTAPSKPPLPTPSLSSSPTRPPTPPSSPSSPPSPINPSTPYKP